MFRGIPEHYPIKLRIQERNRQVWHQQRARNFCGAKWHRLPLSLSPGTVFLIRTSVHADVPEPPISQTRNFHRFTGSASPFYHITQFPVHTSTMAGFISSGTNCEANSLASFLSIVALCIRPSLRIFVLVNRQRAKPVQACVYHTFCHQHQQLCPQWLPALGAANQG